MPKIYLKKEKFDPGAEKRCTGISGRQCFFEPLGKICDGYNCQNPSIVFIQVPAPEEK